jgi:hypothetical protein
MSFSVSFIGSPDAIKRRLAQESENLTGQSKAEFDAVLPALNTVLDQQVGHPQFPVAVQLIANGHATFVDGVKTYGQCTVEVRTVGSLVQ